MTPKLRFPEFSGAWQADIFGSYLESISSGRSLTLSEKDGTYSIYGSTGEIGRARSYDYAGDRILIARVGANAGNIYRINGRYKVSDNTLIVDLTPGMQTNFAYYLLDEIGLNKIVFGSGQPLVTGGQIKKLKIKVPMVEEQQKIADFLTVVDNRVAAQQQKVELLKKYKKGVMQKIFTQQIRFKDEKDQNYPNWQEKKLEDIFDVRDGTHESPKYHSSGKPLITSKNLNSDGSLDFNNVSLISEEDFRNINKRSGVDKGDILFGMIGTIGNPVRVASNDFAIKNVALIKPKTSTTQYLIHYLNSSIVARQFQEKNSGGTQKFIALGDIRKLNISAPSDSEQQKIADFLTVIDDKIQAEKAKLTAAKIFKKGLLQRMFV